MTQPLKTQQVLALFGETAGRKLLNFLQPCCGSLVLETSCECVYDSEKGTWAPVLTVTLASSITLLNQILFVVYSPTVISTIMMDLPANTTVSVPITGELNPGTYSLFVQTPLGVSSNVSEYTVPVCPK